LQSGSHKASPLQSVSGQLPELKISENLRAVPVSPPPLSEKLMVQLPSAFCPSNADIGWFGEKLPEGNCKDVVQAGPGFAWVSTDGTPPSSFRTMLARLLLLQPKVDAGTPGRSKTATVVPPGDVTVILTSPTHVWLTPQSGSPVVPSQVPPDT